MTNALEVEGLTVRYGGVVALSDFSLKLESGELVTVLGANGAGKTSMLRGISGYEKSTGFVSVAGRRLESKDAALRARAGLGHVLEGRHVFPRMTVAENLRLGSLLAAEPRQALGRALNLLPELNDMLARPAGTLSGGQQQMLAIARALSADPKVLLLDEPTNGLAPLLVERTVAVIEAIKLLGVGVLLVEQRVDVARALESRVLILQRGDVVRTADGTDTRLEDLVHDAYLGGERKGLS